MCCFGSGSKSEQTLAEGDVPREGVSAVREDGALEREREGTAWQWNSSQTQRQN